MNALEAFVLSSNPLKPSSEMLEVDETPINDDPDLRHCELETSTPSPQFFPKKDNNRDVLGQYHFVFCLKLTATVTAKPHSP